MDQKPSAASLLEPAAAAVQQGGTKVRRNASFSPSSSRTESPDEQKIHEYLGSPVVMRRTKAVLGELRQQVTSDDMDDCTVRCVGWERGGVGEGRDGREGRGRRGVRGEG